MKRMVFVILVAVFAQNALAVEDTGYYCKINNKIAKGKKPIKCQKGDMVILSVDYSATVISQVCVVGTVSYAHARPPICQYRGSFRKERE